MLATCLFIVSTLALIDLNIFWDQPKIIYNEADIFPAGDEISTRSEMQFITCKYFIFDSIDSKRSNSGDDFLAVLLAVVFCIASYLLVVPIHRQIYMYDFFLFKVIFYIQFLALVMLLFRRYRWSKSILKPMPMFLIISLLAQIYVAIQLYWILTISLSILTVSSGLISVSSEY